MAEIVVFIEHDMYLRNFLSSGAFDRLLEERSVKISPSELVSPEQLRPWERFRTRSYERQPRNRAVVHGWNKLSIRRFRKLSTTFDIKVRSNVPFGPYGLRDRIRSTPGIYELAVRKRFWPKLEPNPSLEAVITEERPKLAIFVVTGVESTGYELIRLAERHDFRTFFLVNGWDNLSSKGVFAALPDHLGLWGPQSVDDAVTIHGMPRERTFLLGCARYAPYFDAHARSGPSPFPFPYVVFAGATTACDELTPLKALDATLARLGAGELRIVYRPHPWREPRLCPDLFDPQEFGRTILDPHVAQAYYANKKKGEESVAAKSVPSLDYYPRLLNHASFVISPMSSMILEAALFDVPAIVLAHDDGIHPIPVSLIARFRHFGGARDVPGWHFIDDLAELQQAFEQLYRKTQHDGPSHRSFAPGLGRAMARYLFMDGRSYAERLLEATDTILKPVDAGRRGALHAVGA